MNVTKFEHTAVMGYFIVPLDWSKIDIKWKS
jgi:hypothetical protein